jgi:outer membrane protein assembly factor BamB
MRFPTLLLAAAVLGAGCAGKDTVEPPAKLVEFESTLRVERVWTHKIGGATERLRLGLTPASDGARVFAGAFNGKVVALDIATGDEVWSQETELPLASGPGFGAGMLVFGTSDGDLVALDAATGEERWRVAVGSEVLAAPAVSQNVVVFRSVDGRLRGASTTDGSTLWTVESTAPSLTLRGNTAPRVAGVTAVCGFSNGRVGAYSLADGETLWEVTVANPTGANELERLVDIGVGLQVAGNDVYAAGFQGRAIGVDLNTGLVLWEHDVSSYAGLGADGANVYVTDEFSAITALARRGGSVVWNQAALRLRDVTAPVRFRDAVVVGDFEGYLHWLDVTDGHFLARSKVAGERITSTPLVVGVNLLVQADDGTLAAFALVEDEDDEEEDEDGDEA